MISVLEHFFELFSVEDLAGTDFGLISLVPLADALLVSIFAVLVGAGAAGKLFTVGNSFLTWLIYSNRRVVC